MHNEIKSRISAANRRPRQRWLDRVKDDLKKLSNGASIEDAEDREVWRTLVEAAKRLNGA
ncbi:hypothetical protein ACI65C_003583 [Semiaphis heraclei]